MPAAYASEKPFATEYSLACVALPKDQEYVDMLLKYLREDTSVNKLLLNVEYRQQGQLPAATLETTESHEDIIKNLIVEGLLLVENRREHRLAKLVIIKIVYINIPVTNHRIHLQVSDYKAAQEEAKKNRRNIWEYGDITEDDAKEFGVMAAR